MNILIQDKPQSSFSKAASSYEMASNLQKKIGLELLKSIPEDKNYVSVLDVGMGTGWLTERMGIKFPNAHITGVDLAPGMILKAQSKRIGTVLQADAQVLPFKDSHFDLIISNCAYQWVEKLDQAFCSSRRVLKDGGDFYFSCFGKETLRELWTSLKTVSKDLILRDKRWEDIDKNHIFNALAQSGFSDIDVYSKVVKIEFDNMFDLIRWLKTIGANQVKRKAFVGRNILNQVNDFYQNQYRNADRIYASFEIIKAKARK